LDSPHIYALLTLCGCCFALFIKTLWPYYFLDDYVLVSIWWLALGWRLVTWRARLLFAAGLALPTALVVMGQVVDSGISMRLPDPQWRAYSAWYSASIVLFAAVIVGIWAVVAHRRRLFDALPSALVPGASATSLQDANLVPTGP